MKPYIIHNPEGDILQVGMCPESMLHLQEDKAAGRLLLEGQADPAIHRVVNGQVVLKPVTEPVKPAPGEDNTYRLLRYLAYPSLREFADAVYWQQRGDPGPMETYLTKCDEVKTNFPKPNVA